MMTTDPPFRWWWISHGVFFTGANQKKEKRLHPTRAAVASNSLSKRGSGWLIELFPFPFWIVLCHKGGGIMVTTTFWCITNTFWLVGWWYFMRIFFPFWRYFIIFTPSPLRNGCDCRGPTSHNHGEATVLKMKIYSDKGKCEDIRKEKCLWCRHDAKNNTIFEHRMPTLSTLSVWFVEGTCQVQFQWLWYIPMIRTAN